MDAFAKQRVLRRDGYRCRVPIQALTGLGVPCLEHASELVETDNGPIAACLWHFNGDDKDE